MTYTAERALFASNALVYLAIAFGTLSFWSDAVTANDPISYLVATLLTVAFGSVSFILSGVVTRFAEAKEKDADVTALLAVGLGAVLVMIEAGMTHLGLAWLDARKHLGPDYTLVIASFGLSAMNVFSIYVFAREIKAKKMVRPNTTPLNDAFFGQPAISKPTSVVPLFQSLPVDPNTAERMKEIRKMVNRAGRGRK